MSEEVEKEQKELEAQVDSLVEELESKPLIIGDGIERISELIKKLTPPAEEKELEEEKPEKDIRAQIQEMKIPGKIKLAMFGNAVCRGLLINDKNRLIQQFVLRNPKLTIKEVEEFSKNANLSENVLRSIADKREFIAAYQVKLGLVLNPKTPLDVSLKWIRYIQSSDLKRISKSKGIPQVVASAAKKRLEEGDK